MNSPKPVTHQEIVGPASWDLFFSGPPLEEGLKPALFYFALSGTESLSLSPINQPVSFLQGKDIRVFSTTIPSHDSGLGANEAFLQWPERIRQGDNFLLEFLERMEDIFCFLEAAGLIERSKVALGGISRGGFLATHVAATQEAMSVVLGFAPVCKFSGLASAPDLRDNSLAMSLNLEKVIHKLVGKKLRYYIGNRDLAVSTEHCFQFTQRLVEENFKSRLRSPPVELMIGPSIGHRGHGTPSHIFKEGALWALEQISNS